ncbi:MAG TPA: MFS transporter [Accumulibacter sp.]|nr:MFS transporter [Accumulibacter sp.]HMW16808.1 MFS transporter [Accumulibacter sp.]HMX21862.1 MFS transporter [Accumulibacter sp.]HMY05766.1 MFS transporter [Accumulibacter sp.]HNC17055.1 MFS transporter [Accumulibacter sp.]
MSSDEKRAGVSLAAVFALRMLGLFLILPVFAIYARTLPSGNDVSLVGMALGAYGLTQAALQIAYGAASDRFGRKPVIIFGLLLFALGSFIAAGASDIHGVIVGRILQGAGAISAAVTALAADLTREQHLTKVMAMIGSSIGLVFALSMVGGPLLYTAIGMTGIFLLTGGLALFAIGVVLKAVPAAPVIPRQPAWPSFIEVLGNRQLLRLNFGVFALHLMLTAMWVLIPAELIATGDLPVAEHWKVYLSALLLSFAIMVPAIIAAERRGRMKAVFNTAIVMLLLAQAGFGLLAHGLYALAFWLTLFFIAFNILEATQPSLISKIAPPHAKGAALGVYNTTQSLGLFLGGVIGGMLAKYAGPGAVWLTGAVLAVVWLSLGLTMNLQTAR